MDMSMWDASFSSVSQALQKGLTNLVNGEGQKEEQWFCWPSGNAGLSPAYEVSSSFTFNLLQKQEEENRTTRTTSRKDFFVFGEGDTARLARLMEAKRSTAGVPPCEEDRCTECALNESHGSSSSSSSASSSSSETKDLTGHGWIGRAALASVQAKAMMKDISVLERAQIGAGAGGIAGAITYACLHPLDTVKTKLQTRSASHLYSGPLDVIVKTFQNQGVLGFYSGISAVLVGSMLSSAVYFGTCELCKALLSQLPSFPAVVIPPLAGAMGNLVSSAILVPKELITQRMQAGAQGRSWEVLLRTVEKEGFIGLYTGYSAALVRNLPASVLSFSSFEYLKAAWLKKSGKNRLEPWQSVLSGALAGAISSALTTPLDVVKTRLMTQARTVSVGSFSTLAEAELQAKIAASTYKGITSTLRKIWLEEGWRGLTTGVLPRILYSACFSALGYFAFETARLALVKRHLAKKKKLISCSN